jgi:hypothetical protein
MRTNLLRFRKFKTLNVFHEILTFWSTSVKKSRQSGLSTCLTFTAVNDLSD